MKAPKIYIRDSGILHALLNITEYEWDIHPKRGISFEGFAIEELICKFGPDAECFFWRTQLGAELDLLVIKNGKLYGFEIKHTDYPSITKSMHIALEDLTLEHLYIVTPSNSSYAKTDKVSVLGIKTIQNFDLS